MVVTLNFRINVFGFSGAPDTAQNVGLRDQRLAVEWIHDNIRNFGGNPDRIVIGGQSSGSVAVDYWSFAYVEKPIVSGYFEHSGNALSFGLNSNELALEHWYNISSLLGCGEQGDTLPCMRAIENITAIEEAATRIEPPPSTNPARVSPIFQPTPDGVTVFDDYKSRYENGSFSRLVNPSLRPLPLLCPVSLILIRPARSPRPNQQRSWLVQGPRILARNHPTCLSMGRIQRRQLHLPGRLRRATTCLLRRANLAIPLLWRLG